jgi:hypothetical protein
MSTSAYFSKDYSEARGKFRDAATAAGARLTAYQNPLRGPQGEKLFTDMAWVGPADASLALLTISATHGVEGHCGSGCQVAAFATGLAKDLPPNTALIAVHAINPHGFAWSRRVTEDNVDLNRNFVDHTLPYPRNPGYETLYDAIAPADWSETGRAKAKAKLETFAAKNGPMALQTAISGGQYTHPDGVFFGGHAPTWSLRTTRTILNSISKKLRHLAVLDFHTGLGPYGHGELIAVTPPSWPSFTRVQAWLDNDVMSPELGTSTSAVLNGTNQIGMQQMVPHLDMTGLALEYGVVPLDETLNAVRADNWLHVHGDLNSAQGREIKAEMRRAFYGDKDDWKKMIVDRAEFVTRRMLNGLRTVN